MMSSDRPDSPYFESEIRRWLPVVTWHGMLGGGVEDGYVEIMLEQCGNILTTDSVTLYCTVHSVHVHSVPQLQV
jgi:hypothetical protein